MEANSSKRPHGLHFTASDAEKASVDWLIEKYQTQNPSVKIGLRAAILMAIEELKGK